LNQTCHEKQIVEKNVRTKNKILVSENKILMTENKILESENKILVTDDKILEQMMKILSHMIKILSQRGVFTELLSNIIESVSGTEIEIRK
jgi:hypothetical protein